MAVTNPRSFAAPRGLRRIAALAAGDTLALLIFAAVGRASHAEAAGLGALLQTAETAAPFVAGWFVVAPLAGAFRPEVASRPGPMLARTALAWLLAWPLSLGLRALLLQRPIPIPFALVTLAAVFVMIGLWRLVFALLSARTERR
jgi:hypothetical protein